MTESIIEISREFFREVVLPLLGREMPEVAEQAAFGLFGYGSEAYGLDDEYSRDHHWGLRIDALMPAALFAARRDELLRIVAANLPATFRGTHCARAIWPGRGWRRTASRRFSPARWESTIRRTPTPNGCSSRRRTSFT